MALGASGQRSRFRRSSKPARDAADAGRCHRQLADVQQQARELALKYVDDPTSVPPTLASTVLNVAAYGGDAMLYDLYMAQLPKLSGQAGGVLPLLQCAAMVP